MPIIKTQTLTRDHFDNLSSGTVESAFHEGVIRDENGSERDVAVSLLCDPMGLHVIDVQLISEPRNPIVSIHEVAPVRAGKKQPPPPAPDPEARVSVPAPGRGKSA